MDTLPAEYFQTSGHGCRRGARSGWSAINGPGFCGPDNACSLEITIYAYVMRRAEGSASSRPGDDTARPVADRGLRTFRGWWLRGPSNSLCNVPGYGGLGTGDDRRTPKSTPKGAERDDVRADGGGEVLRPSPRCIPQEWLFCGIRPFLIECRIIRNLLVSDSRCGSPYPDDFRTVEKHPAGCFEPPRPATVSRNLQVGRRGPNQPVE
jgi:hypothetical protein